MEWEAIVNQNSNAKKQNVHHTRKKKYLKRIIISCSVGIVFFLTTIANLVHPVLGASGMVTASWIAFFELGRLKESA